MKTLTSPHPFLLTLPTWANKHHRLLRHVTLVLLGSWFIALCAKIEVPMVPVPITMQTFGVMLVGALYGWRLGGLTLCAYLGQGILGLPMFAAPATAFGMGYVYLMGATGGYLVGFIFAALVMGWAVHRPKHGFIPSFLLGYILSNIAIFGPGVLWLSQFVGGFEPAIKLGFLPFLAGDVLKGSLTLAVLLAAGHIKGRMK